LASYYKNITNIQFPYAIPKILRYSELYEISFRFKYLTRLRKMIDKVFKLRS